MPDRVQSISQLCKSASPSAQLGQAIIVFDHHSTVLKRSAWPLPGDYLAPQALPMVAMFSQGRALIYAGAGRAGLGFRCGAGAPHVPAVLQHLTLCCRDRTPCPQRCARFSTSGQDVLAATSVV